MREIEAGKLPDLHQIGGVINLHKIVELIGYIKPVIVSDDAVEMAFWIQNFTKAFVRLLVYIELDQNQPGLVQCMLIRFGGASCRERNESAVR